MGVSKNSKMADEEIKEIINRLRDEKKLEEAYIGFFDLSDSSYESYIKANRQGLEIYAANLLEAAITKYSGKSKSHGLDVDIQDEEADYIFQFVDLTKEKKEDIKPNIKTEETWKDKASNFGCITLVILIFVSIIAIGIIGLITVFKWAF